MDKARIYLCDLTHDTQTVASNAFPLGVGTIGSYAAEQLHDRIEVTIFKYQSALARAVIDAPPRVVGFSDYIWNFDLGYSMARAIKQRAPQTVIVFGGPNYPTEPAEQEQFLAEHPAIDFFVYKEGELAFTALLERLLDLNFEVDGVKKSKPLSCHFMMDSTFVATPVVDRIKDLTIIPSPYTTGLLDRFFDGKLMPLLQTNRGCPFACTFCVEGLDYYNKINRSQVDRAAAELEYIGSRIKGTRDLFIADSNFGMYPEDLETCREIARVQEKYGWPEYIHVATGKNQKERVLKAAEIIHGALRLSASVQSLDEGVLENIKRKNISADQIIEVANRANAIGSNTYSEIILCLPGDTKEAHFKTIKTVIDAGLNFIRLFTLMLLPGTEMASRQSRKEYGMISKYRVLPRCFGSYSFDRERLHSVEIEEVCVANNTMSFEDYLDCRMFDLSVEVFYNDAIFQELLGLIRFFKISTSDWLLFIHEHMSEFPLELQQTYSDFRKETATELWDSREDLEAFAKTPETIAKYIAGELGSNLIFKYKAQSFFERLPDLHAVAYRYTAELLKQHGCWSGWLENYLDQLQKFSAARKGRILQTDDIIAHRFSYDMKALCDREFSGDPRDFQRLNEFEICFAHTGGQAENIRNHVNQYGVTPVGLARILSKIHVKKMYRIPQYADMQAPADDAGLNVMPISPGTYQ
jgi:radical SAM superfamily enzyme YgiQ (UPF0313 family)